MSQFRFAASAALILFVLAPAFAQDSGCEPRPAIPQCPTQDCQSGCRGNACIPADQLWANYANEIGCKGCVRYQKMASNFPGLGGKPACDVKGCNPGSKACFGLPSMSISWPRPFHGSNANCNSMRVKVTDVFNVFGAGKQKKVRCDIPNDCFGKLGESKACDSSYFKPLPTVPAGESSDRHAPAVDEPVIPPAPVVEPAPGGNNGVAPSSSQGNDSVKLPLIHSPRLNESAKNVQYGSYFRPKR